MGYPEKILCKFKHFFWSTHNYYSQPCCFNYNIPMTRDAVFVSFPGIYPLRSFASLLVSGNIFRATNGTTH